MIDPLFFEYQKTKSLKLRDKLIIKNIKLAYKIAHDVHRQTFYDFNDLKQESLLGLVIAIENYNPHKGLFSSYAVLRIKGRLYNFLRDKSNTIRIPRKFYDLYSRITKARQILAKKLNKNPTKQDIITHLGISKEDYDQTIDAVDKCRQIGNLEQSVIDTFQHNIMNYIYGDYSLLTQFQKDLISLFFFKKLSLGEISKEIEKTPEETKLELRSAILAVQLHID